MKLYVLTSTSCIIIMSSPGQKRGTCRHVMALFDSHKKCARCREEVGDDPCVKKLDCQICKGFTPAQVQQLATPTYKSRKECGEQKETTETASSATPTLVDPSDITLLDGCTQTSHLLLNLPPRRRGVLIALLNPASGSTAVNPLLRISKVWMTSGVRSFHDLKLCFLISRLLCR